MGLFESVPLGSLDPAELPEATARRLFDSLHLSINFDKRANTAIAKITLDAATSAALGPTLTGEDGPAPGAEGATPTGFSRSSW